MIVGDHKKRDKPHWADYALAMAYETIESEKCQKCGIPIWWAYSENSTIDFEHDHIDCQSCLFDEKNKPKNPKAGRTLFVKAIPVEGFDELPTRADFMAEMMERAVKKLEKKK